MSLPSSPGAAQAPPGGLELALHGDETATAGRPWRVAGQAFEVRGVARLRPLPRARVVARYETDAEGVAPGETVEARADADGRFVLDVPIPDLAEGASRISIEVTDPRDDERSRELQIDVRLVAPEQLLFYLDRRYYAPGEPIHLWALARDERGRPLEGREVLFNFGDARLDRTARTDASGVAYARVALASDVAGGSSAATASLVHPARRVSASRTFVVGQRRQERLFVDLDGLDDAVVPAGIARPTARVTDPSGGAVAGTAVKLTLAGLEPIERETGADGVARFELRAPAYVTNDRGVLAVRVEASHPAHGVADATGRLTLAVPLALQLEVVAAEGALVPEVPSTFYLRVTSPEGRAVEDAAVHVRGPGLPRETLVRTDAHGMAEVSVRVAPSELAYLHDDTCGEGMPGALYDIRVEGPRDRVTCRCVPVHVDASADARVDRPVLAPGERLDVSFARRPAARAMPLAVLLWDARGALVGFEVLPPARARTRLVAPDALGVARVEVRALDPEGTTTLGVPSHAHVLVRPEAPSFLSVRPEVDLYPVGGTASLRVGDARAGWVALNVRDLAQHGGEQTFDAYFGGGAITRDVLDPSTPEASRLIRAALADFAGEQHRAWAAPRVVDDFGVTSEVDEGDVPAWDLRDPRPQALLRVHQLGEVFRAVEQALADGAETLGEGRARRLAPDLLESLEVEGETLGGEPLTLAALEDLDPSFRFETIARRIARARLVRVLAALAEALDEDELESLPPQRWLSQLVRRGRLDAEDLRDPWDGVLGLRARPTRQPALAVALDRLTFAFPGPDGRLGTADDIVDPFAREVPTGTLYAIASGEDALQRALALVSPGAAALRAMIEAYERVTRAMLDAQIGDAAFAEATQGLMGDVVADSIGIGGLGTIGHGGGGGSGSGYGRGAGGLRVRSGSATVASARIGMGSLRGLVREDLPATLRFVPSHAIDSSGVTTLELPLADAATTYLVEAIHWRADGWLWSASTRVRVDREVVVDAPIPATATEGEVLRLPVRVRNRGPGSRTLRLVLEANASLGIDAREIGEVTLAAGEAAMREVELPLRAGTGRVVVGVFEGQTPRDAIARFMTVLPRGRAERFEIDTLVEIAPGIARDALQVRLPEGARLRRSAELEISGPRATLHGGEWGAWASRLRGQRVDLDQVRYARSALRSPVPHVRARAISVTWAAPRITDEALVNALTALTPMDGQALGEGHALTLLALAPALRAPPRDDRRRAREVALRLADTLRVGLEEAAASRSDDPALHAAVAAALAWTGERRAAREAERRAARHLAKLADAEWLQARSPTAGSQNVVPTALLALARIADEREREAYPLVRTLTRWAFDATSRPPRRAPLGADGQGLAAAALALVSRSSDDPAPEVEVEVDGSRHTLTLGASAPGVATLPLPSVGAERAHTIAVRSAAPGALRVQVSAELRLPWAADARGPLEVAWRDPDGAPLFASADAALSAHPDAVTHVVLHVRNRRPRAIARPVVEVALPAGAELPAITVRDGLAARAEGGVLTIPLPPLLPGQRTQIRLPIRWGSSGRLEGLGVSAWSAERPDVRTVLVPRAVLIGREGTP